MLFLPLCITSVYKTYSTAFAHTCCKSSIYMLLYKLSQTPKASTLHTCSSVFTSQMCYLINHLSVYTLFQNRIQFLETNTKKKVSFLSFFPTCFSSLPHMETFVVFQRLKAESENTETLQCKYTMSSASPQARHHLQMLHLALFCLKERNERKFLLPLEKECHQQEATTAQPQKPPSAVG